MFAGRSFSDRGRCLALCALYATLCLRSAAASLVVFGDSYSDAGTAGYGIHQVVHEALTTPQIDSGIFPLAPYRDGRCSNGLVWTEFVAQSLGLELQSFATANAGSGGVPTQLYIPPPYGGASEAQVAIPDTLQQAQSYVALHGNSISNGDVVLIFIGTNDYMFSQPPGNYTSCPVSQVITAIDATMTIAYSAGARRFVLVNLPPLQTLPAIPGPNPFGPNTTITDETESNEWFVQCVPPHNAALANLAAVYPSYHPNSTVYMYDLNAFWTSVVTYPAAYGFSDSTNPCMGAAQNNNLADGYSTPRCPNPDLYVYWDLVHPSKRFHSMIANDFLQRLGPELNAI